MRPSLGIGTARTRRNDVAGISFHLDTNQVFFGLVRNKASYYQRKTEGMFVALMEESLVLVATDGTPDTTDQVSNECLSLADAQVLITTR